MFAVVFALVVALLLFAAVLVIAEVFATVVFAKFALVSVVAGFDSAGVSEVVCKTETFPVIDGNDSSNAAIKKTAAAPIVIFDKIEAVPRAPKAVLEILLVKSAPASALPGCNNTVATNTRQETKNKPYRKVTNIFLFVIDNLCKARRLQTCSAN